MNRHSAASRRVVEISERTTKKWGRAADDCSTLSPDSVRVGRGPQAGDLLVGGVLGGQLAAYALSEPSSPNTSRAPTFSTCTTEAMDMASRVSPCAVTVALLPLRVWTRPIAVSTRIASRTVGR